ncbi:MAG: tetratricopeptide repeat protein [Acidobacteriota bacterium]
MTAESKIGRRLGLVVVGLLSPLLVLALLEGVLVLAGVGEAPLGEDPLVGFAPGSDLFVAATADDGRDIWRTNPRKLTFFNPQEFDRPKATGTYRVFTLGGSTTAGRPYDHRVAFGAWLGHYLAAAAPERRFEVINAGAISYASYRVALLMQELERYQPDLFVLYTGHNEFLEERSYGELKAGNRALQGARAWLARRRFASLLRPAQGDDAERVTLGAEVETKLDGWTGLERYRRDDALEASVVEHFDLNLDRIIAIARRAGADIVVVDPIANVKDFSPFKAEPGEGLAPSARQRFDELLGRAGAALAEGRSGEARSLLEDAVGLDERHAEGWFLFGQALFAEGDHEAARAALLKAKDEDVAPLRALESIHQRLAAAAERNGVPWIPLREMIETESRERFGHDLLGDEFLQDHVHPALAVHRRLAAEILDWLVREGQVAAALPVARRAEIDAAVMADIDRSYYAQRDLNLAKVLGWAGKLREAEAPLLRAAEILPDDPELLLNLGILYQKTGRPALAVERLERATDIAPERAEGWFNLGVAQARLGRRDAAIAALETALDRRPDYGEARQNLGVLLREAGRFEESEAALQEVLADRPESAEVYRSLALTHRRAGRWGESEAALRKALALDPSAPGLRADLAVTLLQQGRLEEAEGELNRALAVDPEDAEAWYNRGVMRARQGDPEGALEAYERTLGVDPRHVGALNNLGIAFGRRGELQRASELLVAAIDADPAFADSYFNLAIVYDQAGAPQEALRALRRAAELDPEEERYRQVLDQFLANRGGE